MVFKRTIHFDDTQVDIIVNASLPEAKEISTVLCPGYNPDTELSPPVPRYASFRNARYPFFAS